MIESTFSFLPRIGKNKEKALWEMGISNWDKYLLASKIEGVGQLRKIQHNVILKNAKRELYLQNSSYLAKLVDQNNHWRLFDFFKDEAIYLDIEATGLGDEGDINVIGIFDGINTKTMIRGINLDFKVLESVLKQYKYLVTFNGLAFDVPFIRKRFPTLIPNIPHLDLKHVCRKIGLVGGLKEIEKQLGIQRRQIILDFKSGDPYRLWKMYRVTGDDYYLNLLIEYNEEDTMSLKTIAQRVVGELTKRTLETQSLIEEWEPEILIS